MSFHGLASVIPLDYGMTTGGRTEHSIIVVPTTWKSMVELIHSPATFMSTARSSFSATPTVPWSFHSPISVVIEPLTVISHRTLETLEMLCHYLPELSCRRKDFIRSERKPNKSDINKLIDSIKKRNPRISKSNLESLVSEWMANYSSHDQSDWAQKYERGRQVFAHDRTVAEAQQLSSVLKQWASLTPAQFRDAILKAVPGSVVLNGVLKSSPGMFVAEFAAATRTLIIKYIPPFPASAAPIFYKGMVTPATLSKVEYTNLTFLHFDLAVETKYETIGGSKVLRVDESRNAVAQYRAQFAVSYVGNPAWINEALKPENIKKATDQSDTNYHYSSGDLVATPMAIPNKSILDFDKLPNAGNTFVVNPSCPDPTVFIDSVWPDPAMADQAGQFKTGSREEPVPFICAVGTTIDCPNNTYAFDPTEPNTCFDTGTLILKGYMPPEPGTE